LDVFTTKTEDEEEDGDQENKEKKGRLYLISAVKIPETGSPAAAG
jgi:hypothetical protein